MRNVVIQTEELASSRKANEKLVKFLDITYVKAELKQVANNATHLNSEERTQIIRLLKYFKDLFYVTLGE